MIQGFLKIERIQVRIKTTVKPMGVTVNLQKIYSLITNRSSTDLLKDYLVGGLSFVSTRFIIAIGMAHFYPAEPFAGIFTRAGMARTATLTLGLTGIDPMALTHHHVDDGLGS
jgi:hypothetical protein